MANGKLIDMGLDDEESFDAVQPIKMPTRPDYPYGLRLCITHGELEKLGLEHLKKGDLVHIVAFGEVTFASESEGEEGHSCRAEIQIQRMSAENESTEAVEDDEPKGKMSKLYRK